MRAARCFPAAIRFARARGAIALELRAVISLAWLRNSQGKRSEAVQMLVESYGRFGEGYDTADLQEAEALLQALS